MWKTFKKSAQAVLAKTGVTKPTAAVPAQTNQNSASKAPAAPQEPASSAQDAPQFQSQIPGWAQEQLILHSELEAKKSARSQRPRRNPQDVLKALKQPTASSPYINEVPQGTYAR